MPPSPGYNWYCVLSSISDILVNAARIRASQCRSSPVKRPPKAVNEKTSQFEAEIEPHVEATPLPEPIVTQKLEIPPLEVSLQVND